MTTLDLLLEWFSDKTSVMIALSGGVDSALVAYAAHERLGDSAIAVTADYKTLSQEELDSAKKISAEIGIQHIIINYDELTNEQFVENNSNRCFYCRSELSAHLTALSKSLGISCIVDGTNFDDMGEFRPGINAMHKNGIKSPLLDIRFTKNKIRDVAKSVGLSVYDKPSNACLASRIPWGQRVTAEKLARIELSEKFIKDLTSLRQIRVRDMDGTAKIEVEKNKIPVLHDHHIFQKISDQLLLYGFKNIVIDTQGYSTGKINVMTD